MIHLFEHQNKERVDIPLLDLEQFLNEVWNQRAYGRSPTERFREQRLLQLFHPGQAIKARKYVGVILYKGLRINLLPKVFYHPDRTYNTEQLGQINRHLLWWLSYCHKLNFPHHRMGMDTQESDFLEVLIQLFASYTHQLIQKMLYQQFEENSRETHYLKGRLNFNTYAKQNLGTGRWHTFHCSYDAFVLDNKFNQIIKYVCQLLLPATQSRKSKQHLKEILFILSEVRDVKCSYEDCLGVQFNPLFAEFKTVRDYCALFLQNAVSYSYKKDLQLFAFLLPMDAVFEAFISGFIQTELPEISLMTQRSDTYLDQEKKFKLKPDLYIAPRQGAHLIADTKYKLPLNKKQSPQTGIAQADLYQMVSYAVRFQVQRLLLLYPGTIEGCVGHINQIEVEDLLADQQNICIEAHQLPIICHDLLENPSPIKQSLNQCFAETKTELKTVLSRLFEPLDIGPKGVQGEFDQ